LGVRVWGGGSSGRKRVGVVRSKLMREREKKKRNLNTVEPKTGGIGSTGQTGYSDRPDRSGQSDRRLLTYDLLFRFETNDPD